MKTKRHMTDANNVEHDARASKRKRLDNDNTNRNWEIQSGRIEKVRMKNIMNHADYEYRPTEKLNFLNGSNGSGKSAVLTSIVFGLGGSARMSNRGAANNSLIRHGQNQASVEITLCNVGENSYKSEVYGSSITVVRNITSSGASTYKIKDEHGRIARDKKVKDELERILSCFNIQVDNPIAILHQDSAKTFLYKCDPAKLYEFFMKATQLADCKRDYNAAHTEKKAADDLLEKRIVQVKEVKKEMEGWEKKFQYLQMVNKKRENLDMWKAELAWAMVKVVRGDVARAKDNVGIAEKKIETCKEKVEEEKEKQRNKRLEKAELEHEIQSAAAENDKSESELDELRQNCRKSKEAERNAKKSFDDVMRKKKIKMSEVESLKSTISKIKSSSNSEREFELAEERRKNELDRLEKERAEMEAQITSRQTHMTNLRASIEETRTNDHELKARVQEATNSLNKKTKDINAMTNKSTFSSLVKSKPVKQQVIQSKRDNRLFLFGENMPRLVEDIKANEKRFKTMPVGPIGFHIEFVKGMSGPEAAIIENELRSTLTTFLVADFDDMRLLQTMATKCKMNLPIVHTQFHKIVYDVNRGKCLHAQYQTIFDRLVINNVNVTNFLIDTKGIERILIVKEEAEALDLVSEVGTVPKNLKYALTFNFGQYLPAPNIRTYSVHPSKNTKQVLQLSVDQLIQRLQQECEEHRNSLTLLESQMEDIKKKRKEHENEFFQADSKCKTLRANILKINAQLARVRSEETAQRPPDVEALEEDKEKLEEEISDLDVTLSKLEEKHQAVAEETVKMQQILDERMDAIHTQTRQSEPLREKLSFIEKFIVKLERNKDHFHAKMKEYQKTVEDMKTILAKKQALLEQQTAKAVNWSKDEIETDRKPEAIHRDISVLEDSLKRMEDVHESRDVIIENYEKSKLFFEQLKRQMRSVRETVLHLDRMLEKRKKGFYTIRASVGRRIQMNFACRLQARNFIGELDFDHKNSSLNITVCPQGGDTVIKRDLKGLSGGEKSYTTISLILSMWDVIQPPFRCLDEFDVFMDSVNRRVALDQIISYAKEKRCFQYIFLTPLSIESVAGDDDIQIIQIQKNN